ncbi:MAG: hypothetical protein ACK5JI_08370, partial [Azonexus sp.]
VVATPGKPFSAWGSACQTRLLDADLEPPIREALNKTVRPELVKGHHLQTQGLRQAQPERF